MDIAFLGESKKKRDPTKKWSEGEIAAELKKLDNKNQEKIASQELLEAKSLCK